MKLIYKIILTNLIIIIGLLVSLSTVNIPKVDKTIFELEKKNAKEVLDKVYGMTQCVADRIQSYSKKALEYRKENLKNVSDIVYGILQYHYDQYKMGIVSEQKAKEMAFDKIGSLRYGKYGYIFMFDDTYHIVSHANKKWIGRYMYNKTDKKGNYYAREMIDKTRKDGESFTRYWWAKIEGKEYEKLSYTKLFKPWMIYIGTGVYIDDIEKEVNQQKDLLKEKLIKIMESNPVGKTGYIYVFNDKGHMIIHPNKDITGEKFKTYINKDTGNYIYKDLIKAAQENKPLRYKWNRIDDKEHFIYDKISWVKYEPYLGWYVASSAYIDEFRQTSKSLISDITLYGIIFLIISLLISIFYTKKILKSLDILLAGIKNIKKGNYNTRIDIKSTDEIGEIANSFNNMIDKIEDNIENLDKKVNEKTQEIRQINQELEKKIEEAVIKTKKSEKLLQQQSRLAQMGEMISMIAHQWRQPLGAISSSVIAVQSKLSIGKFDLAYEDDREKFLKFLEKKHNNINSYVKTLSETIDDFRNFFKPDKQKEYVCVCDPIDKALKIVEASMANKGIDIETKYNITKQIYIYSNEVMQVILNILKNAEDNFIDKGTKDPKIYITTDLQNGSYIIEIYDNGGGIPKDILPNIFDPYFSTKTDKNGTGLGLYMSKVMIEEHHNGKLEVFNTSNGVCFKILFNIDENECENII